MNRVGVYEAKTNLPRLLNKVARGARVTIVRHGVPVAVLVPADEARERPLGEVIADLRAFRQGAPSEGALAAVRHRAGASVSRFVLDCSVATAWCFENQGARYSDAVLGALEEDGALVPALWPLEVANVLLVAERRRQLRHGAATNFLALVAELPVEIDRAPTLRETRELLALGRQYRLSAYDAAYLHLAARERLPLATRDGPLRAAMRAAGAGVFAP
jgi:prevent-host-death family protein